jgi:hypothetical protein
MQSRRLPYDLYLQVLLLNGWSDEEIIGEVETLDLGANASLLRRRISDLREATPTLRSHRDGKFCLTKVVRKWADHHWIDRGLLNPRSQRVDLARQIALYRPLRGPLELLLLNEDMSWENLIDRLSEIGNPTGLTEKMIRDYCRLFWFFNGMSIQEKKDVLPVEGSDGMMMAMKGFADFGLQMDFGVRMGGGDLARLAVLKEMAFQFAAEEFPNRHNPTAFVAGAGMFMKLAQEMRDLAPPEDIMDEQVSFDGESIPEFPHRDNMYLPSEEEDDATTIAMVHFSGSRSK